jgi:hypothetical protein
MVAAATGVRMRGEKSKAAIDALHDTVAISTLALSRAVKSHISSSSSSAFSERRKLAITEWILFRKKPGHAALFGGFHQLGD